MSVIPRPGKYLEALPLDFYDDIKQQDDFLAKLMKFGLVFEI